MSKSVQRRIDKQCPHVEERGFKISLAGANFNKFPIISWDEIDRIFGTDTEERKEYDLFCAEDGFVPYIAGVSVGSVELFLTERSK